MMNNVSLYHIALIGCGVAIFLLPAAVALHSELDSSWTFWLFITVALLVWLPFLGFILFQVGPYWLSYSGDRS